MASARTALTIGLTGTYDIFVAKIGSAGNWEWATSAGGVSADIPVSMVGLSSGSALVTGHFDSNASFYSASMDPGSTGPTAEVSIGTVTDHTI